MAKTKWLAALSDGTTAVEGIPPFADVKDELSPWNKLLAHLKANSLHITGMRIQVSKPGEATRTYNLPSQQRTPKGNHEKWVKLWTVIPDSYKYRRWVTATLGSGRLCRHIEIRACFTDRPDISLFVDMDEGNECWVVLHEEKPDNNQVVIDE